MQQSALLEFESTSFAVEHGEDALTNSGVFGKALAGWLSEQLRGLGVRTTEVIAEDFGWCIPVESAPHRLFVVCVSVEESAVDTWRVFVFAEGGLLNRLLGRDRTGEAVSSLFDAVKHVLARSPRVHALREEGA